MLNNESNQAAEFIVGNCPSCAKYVRVPIDTSPVATVKCPMCGEAFQVSVLIEDVVPSVEVVDDVPTITPTSKNQSRKSINAIDTPELFHVKSQQDYEPITEKKNGRFIVPKQLAKGTKKRRRRRSRNGSSSTSSSPSTNVPADVLPTSDQKPDAASDALSSKMAANAMGAEERVRVKPESESSKKDQPRSESRSKSEPSSKKSNSNRSSSRRRSSGSSRRKNRQPDNPLPKMMVAALIAFVGLPLAQLMLWWFIGADPMGLAPGIAKVAPFMVPSQLAAVEEEVEEVSGQNLVELDQPRMKIVNPNEPVIQEPLPTPNLDPDSVHIDPDQEDHS